MIVMRRVSPNVIWRLSSERQDILEGKKARFTAKTFSSGEEGKEIVISELDSAKSLTIRDYNDHTNTAHLDLSSEEIIDSSIKQLLNVVLR
ncbi:hypothetical protein KIN20_029227 [Parelaphostrongylus tenuis]|uniref:Uncharacterized protein n=1 Tax=Parelaphostrongylus tenuis TaxID=148309 RepID=A0AAD5R2A6_PARTN|nr:hypothetical protein KIN20_029227 [Parelaphostrongylus tenuis]